MNECFHEKDIFGRKKYLKHTWVVPIALMVVSIVAPKYLLLTKKHRDGLEDRSLNFSIVGIAK